MSTTEFFVFYINFLFNDCLTIRTRAHSESPIPDVKRDIKKDKRKDVEREPSLEKLLKKRKPSPSPVKKVTEPLSVLWNGLFIHYGFDLEEEEIVVRI